MESVPKYVFLSFLVAVVGALVAIGLLHRGGQSDPPLEGAGSTSVNPLMVQWSHDYEKTENGCRVSYRSNGSGAGIKSLIDNTVNFACSDAPMTEEQLAAARQNGGDVLHIPLVMGAVAAVYNLPGVNEPVRFTGPVLARIYMGKKYPGKEEEKILRWNHSALRDLNPGIKLPDEEIVVIHRSDGSGTTYTWADYLSKVSPKWKDKVGAGTELKWPAGVEANGNDGVSLRVQETPFAVGYVELIYAYRHDLAYGLIKNRAGEFIRPSLPAVTVAANNALDGIPDDLRFSLTDAPGKGSYPIAGTTWALVRAEQPKAKKAQLVHFLTYATGDGQARVHDLFYARLPEPVVERARAKIAAIQEGK
jgi:phosphate transport system substrate-binding protein